MSSGLALSRRELLVGGAASFDTSLTALPAQARNRSVAERYRFPTRGREMDSGGAIIGINGPMKRVLKVVQTYRKYRHILPRVEQSRVITKRAGTTDVYLRAPILNGVAHVWLQARFSPPKRWRKTGRQVLGRMIKGNLDVWYGAWKMYPCGPNRTVLRMEMFGDMEVPVPDEWITPELMWACDKGVTAVRDIVECGKSGVADD
jgi:ribosome-associated toxin RatA of RatAB toxin-antitoxin module